MRKQIQKILCDFGFHKTKYLLEIKLVNSVKFYVLWKRCKYCSYKEILFTVAEAMNEKI
jgi:hypothetical protein